jgi:hypothetical protein
MLIRSNQDFPDSLLARRERNALGTRCAESQADGVPCPGKDCECDDCARAWLLPALRRLPPVRQPHA